MVNDVFHLWEYYLQLCRGLGESVLEGKGRGTACCCYLCLDIIVTSAGVPIIEEFELHVTAGAWRSGMSERDERSL